MADVRVLSKLDARLRGHDKFEGARFSFQSLFFFTVFLAARF